MKIAVVGSGISGIASAWILSKNHDVHLFESDNRLGGHACTVQANGHSMDIGFLIYNELTYPLLTQLFKELKVESVECKSTMSVQAKHKNLEWNTTNLNKIFGQRSNIFKPAFYEMLLEATRFTASADDYLVESKKNSWTLRELFTAKKYSETFCNDLMIPFGAATWSTPEEKMLDFPAASFLSFCLNHKLFHVFGRPIWRTVKNGSNEYIKKISQTINHIHINSPVNWIERRDNSVYLNTNGQTEKFDRVIMATHPPITLKILKAANEREQQILSQFDYQKNDVILHDDINVMPKRKRCWADWNVQATIIENRKTSVEVTYYLNSVQPWVKGQHHFATLNPKSNIAQPILSKEFDHPLFDAKAVSAQSQIHSIQGHGGVYFVGAWSGYGFHEDGLKSAVEVCKMLGSTLNWPTLQK